MRRPGLRTSGCGAFRAASLGPFPEPKLQWLRPRSSPVTVAGAAPDSHRLPYDPALDGTARRQHAAGLPRAAVYSRGRRSSRRGGAAGTAGEIGGVVRGRPGVPPVSVLRGAALAQARIRNLTSGRPRTTPPISPSIPLLDGRDAALPHRHPARHGLHPLLRDLHAANEDRPWVAPRPFFEGMGTVMGSHRDHSSPLRDHPSPLEGLHAALHDHHAVAPGPASCRFRALTRRFETMKRSHERLPPALEPRGAVASMPSPRT